ncbi:phage tail tape measure protein [Haemophilus influenzae]|uniref:phage tail tape measure protein n=1 Tax=Haemophilus influenzae TaxID=727 RepID=UPI000A5EF639|nr:phage tail tape measure protein [Haemophilus influenzae]MCK8858120.1 phage tail tape measure protein [Haemophilus influenzae]MCK8911642.1 phage tail tape measure protein [Haemophilus influenzae]MCK9090064.1 phage tail tape measure protein [Haemophilus influenzae]MDO7276777.1 phage tail tape measure protein [Haemophilus influenzae]
MLGLGKNVALGTSSLISLGTAATTSMLAIAQPAIKFESAMADVKKVVNFDSPAQFKEMEQDILRLIRTIPMASEEIAAIVAAGGQAGIARENLLGYAEDAAKMGVAFDMAAGDAGTAMATMANVLGKPISEMAKFGDAINHLSDNANAKAAVAPANPDAPKYDQPAAPPAHQEAAINTVPTTICKSLNA